MIRRYAAVALVFGLALFKGASAAGPNLDTGRSEALSDTGLSDTGLSDTGLYLDKYAEGSEDVATIKDEKVVLDPAIDTTNLDNVDGSPAKRISINIPSPSAACAELDDQLDECAASSSGGGLAEIIMDYLCDGGHSACDRACEDAELLWETLECDEVCSLYPC